MPFANVEHRTGFHQQAGRKDAAPERMMLGSNEPKLNTTEIRIVEVGPRDGLQHEPVIIPTEAKVSFVDPLAKSGVKEIEAG